MKDQLFEQKQAPGRPGRRGKPFRENEPTIQRINVGMTRRQMNAMEAAFPGRQPSEIVLLALAGFVPGFQTEVKP